MRELLTKHKKEIRHLVLYCLIGGISASVDFLIFRLMKQRLDWNYQIVNVCSVCIGITTSFLLNARFNFKATEQLFVRYLRFFGVGMLGLAISALCLFILIDLFHIHELMAKAASIIVVTTVQFLLNRFYSFKNC